MPIKYRDAPSPAALSRLDQDFGGLPSDYHAFLAAHDGLTIAWPGHCQIPFDKVDDGAIAFGELFGVEAARSSSNLRAFNDEFLAEIAFVGRALLIGEDGGGNPFVLMLDPARGPVLYWDRTHLHVPGRGEPDFPEVEDSGNLYALADDFAAFIDLVRTHAV